MSNSISTLLTRNLHDVFGENDPVRRRAAIDEIFTEGRLPALLIAGQWRFDPAELAGWVEARRTR
jgi:hypothetical protein